MPEVSVIIPVHNGEQTLAEQLDALLVQVDAPPFEVIIVNDHSTDATARILHRYVLTHPDLFRALRTGASRGPSAARNVGAHAARSGLLLFCDADDHVRPTWVRDMTHELRSHALVTGPLDLFTTVPGDIAPLRRWKNTQDWHSVCITASTANLGIDRKLFTDLGGFDEFLRAAEDVELCIRAHLAGHDVTSCDGTVGYRERSSLKAVASQQGSYAFWDTVVCLRYSELIRNSGATPPSFGSSTRAIVAQILHADRLPRSAHKDPWATWLVQLWVKWNRVLALLRHSVA
ncbi:MAG: glycosyltransferase family 2 protein [Acidipropionibacterium sp.]|jgi:glycosyltransferase involved in cell wall biosynthesis|nr:glycosyltransferase family 2 protein [Acidipropionibacterium sp.]